MPKVAPSPHSRVTEAEGPAFWTGMVHDSIPGNGDTMFGLFHTIYSMVADIIRAIPENKELRKHLEQKAGHIAALESIVKNKEATLESITDECEHLKADSANLAMRRDHATDRKEHYKSLVMKANATILRAKKIISTQSTQLKALSDQIDSLAKQDGKFWEAPPTAEIPAFRPSSSKPRAEIIAFMNLKGGVGKTTLTANLGATLWAQGKRVLLIDLDHQRTLTNLVLSALELDQVELAGRHIDKLFRPNAPSSPPIFNLATHVGDKHGYLIAAREELADVEEHVKAQWLLRQSVADARFLLRQALHDPAVQNHFDYILLDCPPRLTLASINALACCDQVLVPVVLDKASAKAIPRLLRWLRKLKVANITPDLDVLGIVSNLTFFNDKYTRREQNILSELQAECDLEWGSPVYLFRQGVPRKAAFAEATETKNLAASTPLLQPLFTNLTLELTRRLAGHESRPPAKVS